MVIGENHPTERAPQRNRSVLTRESALPRGVDLFLVSFVPAILFGVYSLPSSVREAYVLAYLAPTWLTAFTTHFVHLSAGHLVANAVAYVAIVSVVYTLCLIGDRRTEFQIVFVTFLVVLPFVLSGLNVLIERPRVGYGFSGIVMAFLGFLPVALGWCLETQVDEGPTARHAPVLFFLGTGMIAMIAIPTVSTQSVVLGIAAIGVVGSLGAMDRPSIGAMQRSGLVTSGSPELVIGALVLFFALPMAAFSTDPTTGGTIANVYTHALGFCLGFIVPYVALVLPEVTGHGGRSAAPE